MCICQKWHDSVMLNMTVWLHYLESCAYKFLIVKCHIFNITTDYLGDYID